eukprot:s1398_g11.t1
MQVARLLAFCLYPLLLSEQAEKGHKGNGKLSLQLYGKILPSAADSLRIIARLVLKAQLTEESESPQSISQFYMGKKGYWTYLF